MRDNLEKVARNANEFKTEMDISIQLRNKNMFFSAFVNYIRSLIKDVEVQKELKEE